MPGLRWVWRMRHLCLLSSLLLHVLWNIPLAFLRQSRSGGAVSAHSNVCEGCDDIWGDTSGGSYRNASKASMVIRCYSSRSSLVAQQDATWKLELVAGPNAR